MANDIALKLLKFVGDSEARSRMRVPQAKSVRKLTISIDLTFASRYLNSKT